MRTPNNKLQTTENADFFGKIFCERSLMEMELIEIKKKSSLIKYYNQSQRSRILFKQCLATMDALTRMRVPINSY